MKVTIYDRVSFPGFMQWCLKTSWMLGCVFQKLIGVTDAYYGASSVDDAVAWLKSLDQPISEIQYWGHGSPGTIWLAGKVVPGTEWLKLKPFLTSDSLVWFRVCEAFQGTTGWMWSRWMANNLNCTVASHTYVIGLFQSGLHTRTPNSEPSWPAEEGTEKLPWRSDFCPWLPHTILCLKWWIPRGW